MFNGTHLFLPRLILHEKVILRFIFNIANFKYAATFINRQLFQLEFFSTIFIKERKDIVHFYKSKHVVFHSITFIVSRLFRPFMQKRAVNNDAITGKNGRC